MLWQAAGLQGGDCFCSRGARTHRRLVSWCVLVRVLIVHARVIVAGGLVRGGGAGAAAVQQLHPSHWGGEEEGSERGWSGVNLGCKWGSLVESCGLGPAPDWLYIWLLGRGGGRGPDQLAASEIDSEYVGFTRVRSCPGGGSWSGAQVLHSCAGGSDSGGRQKQGARGVTEMAFSGAAGRDAGGRQKQGIRRGRTEMVFSSAAGRDAGTGRLAGSSRRVVAVKREAGCTESSTQRRCN